jgi:hypothetical protein
VKDKAACRPTVEETLTYFCDVEMMREKGREILTPEFAQPRIPHDILFATGGHGEGNCMNFIEAYDVRANVWIKVSITRVY